MEPKIIVIYHRADFDGIFCYQIAKLFFGDCADYIGWDYGDPVPAVDPASRLIMLDISIKELMSHPKLEWIDHHISAIKQFDPDFQIPGLRINGVAACRLAWQYFFGPMRTGVAEETRRIGRIPELKDFTDRDVEEPLAVTLAGEYDIWDHHDPRALIFQHGLRSCEIDYDRLLERDSNSVTTGRENAESYVAALLEKGACLAFAKANENASIIRSQGFVVEWEGSHFLACNHARFNSQLFEASLTPEIDGLLGFCYDGGKGKWKCSLYHAPGNEDIDLSEIAVKYGGGGHKGACGFECAELPFPLGNMANKKIERKAPFYLIVNTNKDASGGGGRKYPTVDEAVRTAGEYLQNGGRSSTRKEDAYYICAPVMEVRLQRPPIIVTEL